MTTNPKRMLVASLILLAPTILTAQAVRSSHDLNGDWRFMRHDVTGAERPTFDDGSWERVSLPHTWNREDPWTNVSDHEDLHITHPYYRGPGWYRRRLVVPSSPAGRRFHLAFEGANAVAEVWVNGRYAGKHIGGYSAFAFDVTELVRAGRVNTVAVRVNNAYNYEIPPVWSDYTMYGGIYRDVTLVVTPDVYIEHGLVSTPSVTVDSALTDVEVTIVNRRSTAWAGSATVEVYDPSGKRVLISSTPVDVHARSTAVKRLTMPTCASPQLWSPDLPVRYSARIRLSEARGRIVDEVIERFGYRWFSFDADSGFSLNGTHLPLRGVNRHQDRQGYGNALPNELHRSDMAMIKSMGANFVRLAHYPQDPAVLEACDSLGLLVWEEIPVVSTVGKEAFARNAMTMLREMITQHYNHPSIIIWGLMNETIRSQPEDELHWTVDLCRELQRVAKQLDPYRKTAQAQFGDRGTDILSITDIRGWNRYHGWYYGVFEDFGPFMDADRQKAPRQVIMVSEYGADNLRGYHSERPMPSDFTEEWAVALHKSTWRQIQERPYIAGSAVWNMFDFASDAKNGNEPRINQKGLVTFDRKPKDTFYFYQSQWSSDPMVYIVSHTWRERYGVAGEAKELEVFSNCDSVEVWLNGASLGSKRPPFAWSVRFPHGYHEIRAVGWKGTVHVDDALRIKYTQLEGGELKHIDEKEQ